MKRWWLGFVLLFVLIVAAPNVPALGAAVSYKARVDPRVLEDTAANQTGRFIVILKAQTDRRALAATPADRDTRVRIAFDSLRQTANGAQSPVRAQLDALGANYQSYWIVDALVVEGDRTVVNALAARSDVAEIETDRPLTVTLDAPASPRAATSIEWNVSRVNAPAVWGMGDTGQGIVYANGDTGVQWNHPALIGHYRGWNGETADHNYNWWDAVHTNINSSSNPCNPGGGYIAWPASGSIAPCDDEGHGTHTMGIGIGDDGAGFQIGVAPGAKWIACRNMDHNVGRPSMYLECYQFFMVPTDLNGNNPQFSQHADVVGNSYGCPIGPPPYGEDCAWDSLQAAMDTLRAVGIFMAVSAGNYGSGCGTVRDPPAIYDSAISVGATDYYDNIAGFSSRGPSNLNGILYRKPDLSAPGVGVRSSVPNGYDWKNGTSMASPHVAGAVALLWSAYPWLRGKVDLTERILEESAVHLTTTQQCSDDLPGQVPNNVYGYGRIDALAAYQHAPVYGPPFKYYFPMIGISVPPNDWSYEYYFPVIAK